MPDDDRKLRTAFPFGGTVVRILQGNILDPPVEGGVEAVVSTDDNYLTMGGGVARQLRLNANSEEYVRTAQAHCPVEAGTAVVTGAYGMEDTIPGVKYVFHGAVIDYDSDDLSLEELVYRATTDCLEKAEERRLRNILFPAFATGAGGLPMSVCARQMCSAIKKHLADYRQLQTIYVILYRPDPDTTDVEQAELKEMEAGNQRFLKEANLVLDTPYDPTTGVRQCRDFYGREKELEQLEEIITGQRDDEAGIRHAVILGGPSIGKHALLDQIFCRAQQEGSPLSEGRKVVRVTFGQVHRDTPSSFIYRKLLSVLRAGEGDEQLRAELQSAYANPDIDCKRFLDFLEEHVDRYPEIVILVDHLPKLLKMEAGEVESSDEGVLAFWQDLDSLQERVRFVYTARQEDYDELRRRRLEPLTKTFHQRIEEIPLICLSEGERQSWTDALFKQFLDRPDGAPKFVHTFVDQEAGRHPFLLSLVGHALVDRLKRDALMSPMPIEEYTPPKLKPLLQSAIKDIERPRRFFFESLLADRALLALERQNLKNLARAVAEEEESQRLLPGLDVGDPEAVEQWRTLMKQDNPRLSLDHEVLEKLERRGYLVDAADRRKAQFMASSFAAWLEERFGLGDSGDDKPRDVTVGFFSPEPDVLTTLFGGRGARLLSAQRRLAPDIREKFVESFRDCISHLLHPSRHPVPGAFQDLEQVANFILTYFATDAIKSYLRSPPEDATILLAVDEVLKEIPWELALETGYGGDTPYPFIVGRSIVSKETAQNIGAQVRGVDKVRALLIGNPTDDLADAETEVIWLRDRLRRDGRFLVGDEDVRTGSEACRWLSLLDTLSSGRYGLIHYSGHTKFDGYQSAWHLQDGKVTTDLLTSALQNAPPALVFSSSCESGTGAEAQAAEYENQTFDLPSAFLQAGVGAYVGTLWEVGTVAARQFVEAFYNAFLTGESLGRCLQQAKMGIPGNQYRTDRLAFILYGDPHTGPGDLFPALSEETDGQDA